MGGMMAGAGDSMRPGNSALTMGSIAAAPVTGGMSLFIPPAIGAISGGAHNGFEGALGGAAMGTAMSAGGAPTTAANLMGLNPGTFNPNALAGGMGSGMTDGMNPTAMANPLLGMLGRGGDNSQGMQPQMGSNMFNNQFFNSPNGTGY